MVEASAGGLDPLCAALEWREDGGRFSSVIFRAQSFSCWGSRAAWPGPLAQRGDWGWGLGEEQADATPAPCLLPAWTFVGTCEKCV